jgi:hypothetical protein
VHLDLLRPAIEAELEISQYIFIITYIKGEQRYSKKFILQSTKNGLDQQQFEKTKFVIHVFPTNES